MTCKTASLGEVRFAGYGLWTGHARFIKENEKKRYGE
jgi:hypothetical protein